MGRLIYSMIMSLDGYVADENGRFDWAEPDEAVHRFANELSSCVGTYLLGRGMYEVMRVWETPEMEIGQPDFIAEFSRGWRRAEKVVYSGTLEPPLTERTRIERRFDAEAVRRMKAESADDLAIAGPTLAAHAIVAGLVDVYEMLVAPVAVGGGLPAFPPQRRVELELTDQQRFDSGFVFMRYRAR